MVLVPIPVGPELVSSLDDFAGELRLTIDHLAKYEEGRLDLVELEDVEYEGSRDRVGPVVEC
jgi:hypothetical protein